MKDLSAARNYAKALFELARDKDELDLISDTLTDLKDAFKGIPEFRAFVFSFRIETDKKIEALNSIFPDKISPLLGNFLRTLFNKKRQELLPEVAGMFVTMALEERKMIKVGAVTHVTMSDVTAEKVGDVLGKTLDREVVLDPEVDPGILGGIVLRIGNRIIDGSVRGNLNRMKLNLKS